MKSAFGVQHGSSGDSHAIVKQLHMIVSRMSGSKNLFSQIQMPSLRGWWYGRMQQIDVELDTLPEGPTTSSG